MRMDGTLWLQTLIGLFIIFLNNKKSKLIKIFVNLTLKFLKVLIINSYKSIFDFLKN